mmetsp:Transcript_42246/g.99196  ORF Transcript_42246/g.99196 Transcript_42246/m.99196 type:complete len:253 (-) Transcript_42246:334-1092(-)
MQSPAELSEVVVAPSVELPFLRQGAHVLVTCGDSLQLQAFQAHLVLGFVAVAPSVCEEPGEVRGLKSAPAPKLAPLGNREGVVPPCRHLRDECLVGKLGVHRQRTVLFVACTQLSEVILAPCKDPATFCEGHGMLLAHRDLANSLPLQRQHTGGSVTLWVTPAVGPPEPHLPLRQLPWGRAINNIDEAPIANVAAEGILIWNGDPRLTSQVDAVDGEHFSYPVVEVAEHLLDGYGGAILEAAVLGQPSLDPS